MRIQARADRGLQRRATLERDLQHAVGQLGLQCGCDDQLGRVGRFGELHRELRRRPARPGGVEVEREGLVAKLRALRRHTHRRAGGAGTERDLAVGERKAIETGRVVPLSGHVHGDGERGRCASCCRVREAHAALDRLHRGGLVETRQSELHVSGDADFGTRPGTTRRLEKDLHISFGGANEGIDRRGDRQCETLHVHIERQAAAGRVNTATRHHVATGWQPAGHRAEGGLHRLGQVAREVELAHHREALVREHLGRFACAVEAREHLVVNARMQFARVRIAFRGREDHQAFGQGQVGKRPLRDRGRKHARRRPRLVVGNEQHRAGTRDTGNRDLALELLAVDAAFHVFRRQRDAPAAGFACDQNAARLQVHIARHVEEAVSARQQRQRVHDRIETEQLPLFARHQFEQRAAAARAIAGEPKARARSEVAEGGIREQRYRFAATGSAARAASRRIDFDAEVAERKAGDAERGIPPHVGHAGERDAGVAGIGAGVVEQPFHPEVVADG